jgi:hypothetical protein
MTKKDDLKEHYMACLSEITNSLHFLIDYIAMMKSSVLNPDGEYDFFTEEQRTSIADILGDGLDDLDELIIEAIQVSVNLTKEQQCDQKNLKH